MLPDGIIRMSVKGSDEIASTFLSRNLNIFFLLKSNPGAWKGTRDFHGVFKVGFVLCHVLGSVRSSIVADFFHLQFKWRLCKFCH